MIRIKSKPRLELRILEHDAPGTWLQDMRARGYRVPLQLCHDVSHGMKAGLSFADMFRLLWRHRKITLVEYVLIYLSGPSLWEEDRPGIRVLAPSH
jgi:hypothetical protein